MATLGQITLIAIIAFCLGYTFHKYRLKYRVKFALKFPGDETWHHIHVVRERNNHSIIADGDLIISEKRGDKIWRADL